MGHRIPPLGNQLLRGRRIGLLGGSFNPAHGGHRHISRTALRCLALDEVWWLVSPQNPLKPKAGMAELAKRVDRAEAVAATMPRVRVTDIEARLGTQFTFDTLRALRGASPLTKFVWLMGADNLVQIPAWERWDVIFATMPVAVFTRKSHDYKALSGVAAHRFGYCRVPEQRAGQLALRHPPAWVFLLMPRHPASATQIRQRRSGQDH